MGGGGGGGGTSSRITNIGKINVKSNKFRNNDLTNVKTCILQYSD